MDNKKLISLFVFFLNVWLCQSQNCTFNGNTKLVTCSEKSKVFKETKSELGTFGLGFDPSSCEMIGDTCYLGFRLFYAPAEKQNSTKPQCEVILCKRKKSKFYPLLNLSKTTILVEEKIKFIPKSDIYLVFYSKGIVSFAIRTKDFN